MSVFLRVEDEKKTYYKMQGHYNIGFNMEYVQLLPTLLKYLLLKYFWGTCKFDV